MNLWPLRFAELAALPVPTVNKTGGLLFKDMLLIVAVIAFITLLLFFLARLFVGRPGKKKRKRKARRRHRTPSSGSTDQDSLEDEEGEDADDDEDDEDDQGEAKSEKPADLPFSRRRRHRHHRRRQRQAKVERGRNPTLAETGGLPPLRSEASSKSRE